MSDIAGLGKSHGIDAILVASCNRSHDYRDKLIELGEGSKALRCLRPGNVPFEVKTSENNLLQIKAFLPGRLSW